MARQSPTPEELEALRAGAQAPSPEETALALKALAPNLNRATARLRDRRAERRSLLWQVLALAGGMAVFAAVAWTGWLNREFLLETPLHRGIAAGILIAFITMTCCLPLLGGFKRGVQHNG